MWSHIQYALVGYFDKNGYPLSRSYKLAEQGLVYPSIIIGAYLLFATVLGPLWMRNRPAYTCLRPYILVYNFSMSLVNLYFFFRYIYLLKFGSELLNLHVPDPVADQDCAYALARVENLYLYLITKYLDLFDTIFFVLRKKNSHISFLHLYHHSSVAYLGTMFFLMYPSSTPIGLFILLNSAIHVVMYFYYGLSAMGPSMRNYLWWKKYITQAQIVQFVIYLVYYTTFALFQQGYDPFLMYNFGVTQSPIYLFLFTRFYYKTYLARKAHDDKLDDHFDNSKCCNHKDEQLRKRKVTYATLSQS